MTDEFQHILHSYRDQIDDLDDKIVDLLTTREGVIRSVAALKKEQNIPAILPARIAQVIDRCVQRSKGAGMNGDYVQTIYTKIVAQSCALETDLMTTDEGKPNE